MSNGVSIEELLRHQPDNDDDVERISFRKVKPSLDIVDPDPTWPSSYDLFASRIVAALGPPSPSRAEPGTNHLVSVSHVGSTSVPGLPAKAIIDIDVVVPDINDESAYIPALEAQGFQFNLREPKWYSHRFFTASEPMFANVHVWPPASPEVERHRILKEWLIGNSEDRELYAKIKKESSEASKLAGESMMQYTYRKDAVVRDILHRALDHLKAQLSSNSATLDEGKIA
ncbi:UPF0157-domain-containing protein [Mollisia scopiformis]|uniref:UPF0157-domain-containing protein n=1 Tax=Mollisia scopiformis TaxID=149040 RepID=A0A132BBL3_MOLSC|nr:UPF0157-domain-containing protein [Mollisia scopiformis]KUJ09663.1 UPF0157-domain-containing protein [Mollisia scopiformis]